MPYDFNGEKYQKASGLQKEWGTKIIAGLTLRGDEKILDLGCGDGALSAAMADQVPDGFVLGIDGSQSMIATAQKSHRRTNLRFLLQDIEAISFAQEFNVIFSNATLHWIKDHVGLLAAVHRALCPGGLLRFNFAAHGNCEHFISSVKKIMSSPGFKSTFSTFSWPWFMPEIEEYEKIMDTLPFSEKKIWLENADRFFPDPEAMIRWIDQPSLVPFLEHIKSQKSRQVFRDAVVGLMMQKTKQPDNTCFETFRRINVCAGK